MQDLDPLTAPLVALGHPADLDQVRHAPGVPQPLSAALTASPSLSDSGGDRTTRSPSLTPVRMWRWPPALGPTPSISPKS